MMIGGLLQPVDDAAYVLDNGGESQRLYRGRVLAQGLDPALEARAGWGQHPVALGLVALHPLLPAQRRDPESVDQDDRVGGALPRGVVGQESPLASPSSPEPRECAPESALGVSPKCVISGSNPARLPRTPSARSSQNDPKWKTGCRGEESSSLSQRQQKVMRYLIERMDKGDVPLEQALGEDYVRRNLSREEVRQIVSHPEFVQAARERLGESFRSEEFKI